MAQIHITIESEASDKGELLFQKTIPMQLAAQVIILVGIYLEAHPPQSH